MSTVRGLIVHKHYRLDEAKIKRAQKVLKAGTETETLDRALEAVIAEHERNRLTREANERFAKSGIEIRDVYGKLEEKRDRKSTRLNSSHQIISYAVFCLKKKKKK